MHAYYPTLHGLRGQGADVLFCDEASFMMNLFHNIVLPILEVKDAILIMISTLIKGWNYYTKLLIKGEELAKEGRELFVVYRVELICERCKSRGDSDIECRHKVDEIPPWKSEEKLDLIKVLMGDHADILRRESMNVVGGESGNVFDPRAIRELEAREYYDWERQTKLRPRIAFLAVDPNAGGASHVALCLTVRFQGLSIICGMDSRQCTRWEEDFKPFFANFLARVRSHPWLKDTFIVVACERNTGFVSGSLREITRNIPNVYTLFEQENAPPGIFTDPYKKNEYAILIRRELMRGSLFFLKDFIVAAPSLTSGSLNSTVSTDQTEYRKEVRLDLFDQMLRSKPDYNEEQEAKRTMEGKYRPTFVSWSAKAGGQNDDKVVDLGIGIYVMSVWEERGFTTVPYDFINSRLQAIPQAA